MEITLREIEDLLRLAKQEKWSGRIPVIHADLRIAVNSLSKQDPTIFTKDAIEVYNLIWRTNNNGIRQILTEISPETFAFAIRDALS